MDELSRRELEDIRCGKRPLVVVGYHNGELVSTIDGHTSEIFDLKTFESEVPDGSIIVFTPEAKQRLGL